VGIPFGFAFKLLLVMDTNEKTFIPGPPSQQAAYESAMRMWNYLTNPAECAITMRSIFVTVRLALSNLKEGEDHQDVEWLLYLGQYLADIETNRPLEA